MAQRRAHSRRTPYSSATIPAVKNGRPTMSIRCSQKSAEYAEGSSRLIEAAMAMRKSPMIQST